MNLHWYVTLPAEASFEVADHSFQVYEQIWFRRNQASNDQWGHLAHFVHWIEDRIWRLPRTSSLRSSRLSFEADEGLTLIKVIHNTQSNSSGSRRGATRDRPILRMRDHPSALPELVLVRLPWNIFVVYF